MNSFSNIFYLLKSAAEDFRRDKIRTALTSLGIMIGVLSVVMLIALGLGLKNYIKGQFENLGANLVMVLPGSGFSGGGAGLVGGAQFDSRDVANLARIEGVKYAIPVFFKSAAVSSGTEEKTGYILGVSEEFFGLFNTDLLTGDVFSKTEVGNRAKVVILGNTIAKNLFGDPADGVGKIIRIQGLRLTVIGVVKPTGNPEHDSWVIMPYSTTYGSLNPQKMIWAIYLGASSESDVATVKQEINDTLLKRYKKDEFSVAESAEILSTVNQIFGILNLVLIAIGSISLLVGGVGIMNIMYATVTERTKEIGIRRAVGARKNDILAQFLAESLVLSAMGGVVGLLLAATIVLVVRIWFPVALNLLAVFIAFGVSSLIGVFFGVFPAKKAADLSPIDAIRYE